MGSRRSSNPPRMRVDNMIREDWGRAGQQHDRYSDAVYGALPQEQQNAQRAFEAAMGAYGNLGGYGLNPGTRGTYEEYQSGAFLDPEARRRLRGGGVYDEYSQTGGWDEGRRRDFRGRIAGNAAGTYQGLRQNLGRMNAVQGGYSPGYTAQASRLSRDAARSGSEAVREGELGMASEIDRGRQWGTQGMTSSEAALQQILNQGRQWGAGGLADADAMTAQMQLAGAQGLAGLRSDTPGYFNLFDNILAGDALEGSRRGGLIGQQGDEDIRRWDRKARVGRGIGGVARAGAAAFGGRPPIPIGA